MKQNNIIKKSIQIIIVNITLHFDVYKFKKYIDLLFIITEKIIVKLDKFIPFYLSFYKKMIENEIKILDITKDKKILHIGCGSIPATSILIAQITNSKIIAIDNDKKSIKYAKLCIKKLNLSDKVKIKHAESLNFNVKDFDVIILSQGVEPHDKILEYISKSIKNETKVILRIDYKINIYDFYIDVFSYYKINKFISSDIFGKLNSYSLSINK